MTNAELLAKIKAEIERRWKDYRNSVTPDQPKYRTHYFVGKGEVCEELLSFLDTLESEKPVPNDLEEAAIQAAQFDMQDRQIMEASNDERMRYSRIFRRGFKAGAKWQKEQDDRLVDIIYQQGIEKGKDEMKETLKGMEK